MKWLLVIVVLVVAVLHQDSWFWKDRALVFGFLPIGMAYHALYSILASLTMALLVKVAWPTHLEQTAPLGPVDPTKEPA
jgi:hypothetical protein